MARGKLSAAAQTGPRMQRRNIGRRIRRTPVFAWFTSRQNQTSSSFGVLILRGGRTVNSTCPTELARLQYYVLRVSSFCNSGRSQRRGDRASLAPFVAEPVALDRRQVEPGF